MASSPQTTKTETKADPWAAAQPALKSLLSNAQGLYNSGTGFNPYPGSTVSPFSGQTNQALQQMQALAGQGNPLNTSAMGNAAGVIGSGGLNANQNAALSGTLGIAQGQNGINTGGQFQDLYNGAAGPGAIGENLAGYARGDYVNGGSPQFNAMLDRQSGALADDVFRGYSNQGRYGSTANTNAVADAVGNFRNDAMANELQREQGLQLQAAGMLSGEQGQRFGQQLAATSGQTGVQGQNIANILGAGQGYTGAVNQGQQLAGQFTGLVPQLYDQQFDPSRMLGQVGSAYDAQNQAMLSDQVARQQQAQQAPWNRLGAFGNIALGAGGLGGTSTGTSTVTQATNPLQMIGGIASSVLPFFLPSDERLKADIEKVGELPNGIGLHRFRYRGDNVKYVGVLAQEVEEIMPEAVAESETGYLMVDYARLGVTMQLADRGA